MARVVAIGEVLWDVFPGRMTLGGAPLNFAAHLKRLGHDVMFVSAVGRDELGERTREEIRRVGLDPHFVGVSVKYGTGTARVQLGENGHVNFTIVRPAAYDDVELGAAQLDNIRAWRPAWFYFGSLFAARDGGHTALRQLLDGIPGACRFYDVNLRAGFDAPDLVGELLRQASVVKVNEDEVRTVHQFAGLPDDVEGFCRNGARRYGWRAVCVTMGERGCALLAGGEYATAPGCKVDVVDPVGAGDAFAAAFLHGLENGWRAARIASFANRLGALVAGRPGAIPEWDPAELAQ